VILLLFLFALSRGPDQYYGFLDWLDLPVVAILGIITLVAVLYHTATSIELASMIQEVRLGEKKIPRQSVMIGMAAGWIVVSVVIALIHLEL
jgi:fumarate reductase subunit C